MPRQNDRIPVEGDIGHIAAFMFTTDFGPLSKKLEHGEQRVLSDAECEAVYPHLHGIVQHFFCGTDERFSACGGAQGAALAVKRNGEQVLAGIISFGNVWRDCAKQTPPGFIRIAKYVDWIENRTNNGPAGDLSSKNGDSISMIGYLA